MWLCRYPEAVARQVGDAGAVVTIGAYDGVHLGHRALLARVRAEADRLSLPAVVMSFEPTPKEFFAGSQAPARLTPLRERAQRFAEAGMDGFFCLRFNAALASIRVDDFIQRLLVDGVGVRHLVIGDDFRFGHKAAGGVTELKAAGVEHGFLVEQVDSVLVGNQRVSSTAIRDWLAAGDLAAAATALGRPYTISGRVIHGQKLGRTLGYPTANLRMARRVSPVSGIFAVRVDGIDGHSHDGVASIGTRPTVDGRGVLLEVFVFDYTGDLYGRTLTITLVEKLRDELKFGSLEALKDAMHRDSDQARNILSRTHGGGAA